jgi:hypothetical protein
VLAAGDDAGPAAVALLVPKALPALAFASAPNNCGPEVLFAKSEVVVVALAPKPGVDGPPLKKVLVVGAKPYKFGKTE